MSDHKRTQLRLAFAELKLITIDAEIQVKKNARVMLTVNVDINDRLINGQMGTIARIVIKQNTNKPSVILITFDDCQAGV